MTPPQQSERLQARRAQEASNRVEVTHDAARHGAHIYTSEEVAAMNTQPQGSHAVGEQGRGHELLYRYQGHDYQAVCSGDRIYHHRLLDGAGGSRPLRRSPPCQAPWQQGTSPLTA